MHTYIKLVGSHNPDADPRNLLRWYSDHVNMLMRYALLQRATLYRRSQQTSGDAPDYICLYEFESREAFDDYSNSPQRKDASRVREEGWGLNNALAGQRSEYVRHSRRTFKQKRLAHAGALLIQDMHCFTVGDERKLDTIRWVDACVQGAVEATDVTQALIHRPENVDGAEVVAGEWLVAIERPVGAPGADLQSVHGGRAVGADDLQSLAPASMHTRWKAMYEEVSCWDR